MPTTTTAIETTPMTTAALTTSQMTTIPLTTTSNPERTEFETTMSSTHYSTVTTVTTTILSTAPTTSPTNTTILIIYDYHSSRRDNFLLYPDGGKKYNKEEKNKKTIERAIGSQLINQSFIDK